MIGTCRYIYSREQKKRTYFWFDRYSYGTGTVLSRFAHGMVEVSSWHYEVQPRYCVGSLEVLVRFIRGTSYSIG